MGTADSPTACMHILAALTVASPVAAVVASFSQMSPFAPRVARMMAGMPAYVGYLLLVSSFVCAGATLWCFGRPQPLRAQLNRGGLFWFWWWLTVLQGIAAAIVLVSYHPIWSLCFLLGVGSILLFPLRHVACRQKNATAWYDVAWKTLTLTAIVCLLTWLSWLSFWHVRGQKRWTAWAVGIKKLETQELITWKFAFVMWVLSPFAALELLVFAFMFWLRWKYTSSHDVAQRSQLVLVQLKRLLLSILSMALLLWIWATLKREDMTDEVISFTFLALTFLTLWSALSVHLEDIALALKEDRIVQDMLYVLQSDLIKAFLLLAALPLIGLYMLIGWCTRKQASLVVGWYWTSVLTKANWLGHCVFLFQFCGPLFNVIMSEVNETLVGWGVYIVSAIAFLVSWLIFMTPPSPAPIVYAFMGFIICRSAFAEGWSFWVAVFWATFVAWTMKLAFTTAAQKWIGEPCGRSAWVLQTVCIHKPYMRAIELIMAKDTVSIAKVAVLVGGPDWPVAVLCGILRRPALPILLCTSPVLVQSVFPCVLTGVLMLDNISSTYSEHQLRALAGAAVLLSGISCCLAGVLAMYFVQKTVDENYDELHQVREQDQWLVDLDSQDETNSALFRRCATFDELPCGLRVLLILGLIIMHVGCYLLFIPIAHMRPFKSFDMTDSREKDLNGNALNIIQPVGWVVIYIAFVNLVILCIFYIWLHAVVNSQAARLGDEVDSGESQPLLKAEGRSTSLRFGSVFAYTLAN